MALDAVTDYITEVRVLVQDQDQPYRYPDADLVTGLNLAIMDSRRLRPDMWIGKFPLPSFSALITTAVTNTGNATLQFASVPSAVSIGQSVYDTTTAGAIVSAKTVLAVNSTQIVLSANVDAAVQLGDTIIVGPACVPVDPQYRSAFILYMCANAQMRDEEETQDTRSMAYMKMFQQILTGVVA